jgi:hypothetical protein
MDKQININDLVRVISHVFAESMDGMKKEDLYGGVGKVRYIYTDMDGNTTYMVRFGGGISIPMKGDILAVENRATTRVKDVCFEGGLYKINETMIAARTIEEAICLFRVISSDTIRTVELASDVPLRIQRLSLNED